MATYDVTALDSALEFDTTATFANSIVKLPGVDKVAIAWIQSTTVVYVQAFNVNTGTGAVTAIGSPVDIEAGTITTNEMTISLVAIDASNLIVFWAGAGNDGFAQLLSVDGTGNVTTNGSNLEYDTSNGTFPAACLMDSTHVLNIWQNSGGTGNAQIFTVDTGAGTITAVGTPLNFDATQYALGAIRKLSATKAVVVYQGPASDGFAIVLNVNTSTWAVTAAGSAFEFKDAVTIDANALAIIDSGSPSVIVNTWHDTLSGPSVSQTQTINNSTWAITNFGSTLTLAAADTNAWSSGAIEVVDTTHVIVAYQGVAGDGFIKVLTYDSGTGGLSATANVVEYDTVASYMTSMCTMEEDSGMYVLAWQGSAGDGFVQAFQVTMPSAGPANLKTYNTNPLANIKTINTNPIANVKTLDTNA